MPKVSSIYKSWLTFCSLPPSIETNQANRLQGLIKKAISKSSSTIPLWMWLWTTIKYRNDVILTLYVYSMMPLRRRIEESKRKRRLPHTNKNSWRPPRRRKTRRSSPRRRSKRAHQMYVLNHKYHIMHLWLRCCCWYVWVCDWYDNDDIF